MKITAIILTTACITLVLLIISGGISPPVIKKLESTPIAPIEQMDCKLEDITKLIEDAAKTHDKTKINFLFEPPELKNTPIHIKLQGSTNAYWFLWSTLPSSHLETKIKDRSTIIIKNEKP